MDKQIKKYTNTKYNNIIKENFEKITNLYNEGLSFTKIGLQFNVSRKTIAKFLKNDNAKIKENSFYNRKYNLNEKYFDVIDTEEKAYILGFIYADGNNLYKNNRISIHLSKVDEEILQKFSLIFYGKTILKYNTNKNNNGKLFNYVSLNLYSKHMSQHLATLGVVECKSYKITFPEWLDKSLHKHFLRGLIDGDGWIYLPTTNRASPSVGLICTKQINDKLTVILKNELDLKSYLCKAYKQDFNVMCEIRIKNYHQCKIFLDWLYKDSTIYLERKYNLYLQFLEKYKNLREQNK